MLGARLGGGFLRGLRERKVWILERADNHYEHAARDDGQ